MKTLKKEHGENFAGSYKKFARHLHLIFLFRSAFRTLSHIYNNAFCENSYSPGNIRLGKDVLRTPLA